MTMSNVNIKNNKSNLKHYKTITLVPLVVLQYSMEEEHVSLMSL